MNINFTNIIKLTKQEEKTLKYMCPGLKVVKTAEVVSLEERRKRDQRMLKANEDYRKKRNKEIREKELTQRIKIDLSKLQAA